MQLVRRIQLLPTIIGGIEAWQAFDGPRPVTAVKSRDDIIENHRKGELYFSNIAELQADLREIGDRKLAEDELPLLEVRSEGDIPIGLFAPLEGWVLRDLVESLQVERELAAAIALAIYHAYSGGPNVLTRDGNLVRTTLPLFEHIWEREMPSFIGNEPDISIDGRIAEMCDFYLKLGGEDIATFDKLRLRAFAHDYDGPELAMLASIAHPDPGPALIRALRLEH